MNLPETIHFDFDPKRHPERQRGGPQVMSLPDTTEASLTRAGFRANQFNAQNTEKYNKIHRLCSFCAASQSFGCFDTVTDFKI